MFGLITTLLNGNRMFSESTDTFRISHDHDHALTFTLRALLPYVLGVSERSELSRYHSIVHILELHARDAFSISFTASDCDSAHTSAANRNASMKLIEFILATMCVRA